jgi:hypothetical protein
MASANNPLKDNALSEIGTRGIVFHDGDPELGTYQYFSDNANESWRTNRVDLGRFVQDRGLPTSLIESLVSADVPVAVVKVDAPAKTFFVNLEAFHQLGAGGPLGGTSVGSNPPANVDAILIREKQNYYAISRGDLHTLDTADASEAKILVRRGAVTAGIPNNDIPYGTNCVLVNLTQLLP